MNRALKIAGISASVIFALLIGSALLAYLLLDLDKVINEQVARFKPQLEEKLGRKVEIGRISTRFFPTLGGDVEEIAIAPDPAHPEDDRALVRVERVGFDVAIWKAILSGGKTIVINKAYVDGMKVNLVRYADGRLSYEDILARQPPSTPEAEAASEPLSPEVQAYLQGLSIGQVRLGDAEIRLVDHATPTGKVAESFIRKLNVKLEDVRLSDPVRLRVDAAVFSDQTNFEFETEVGPLPADLKLAGAPRIGLIKVRARQIDLSRIAPYLGPGVPARIESALLSASLDVGEVVSGKPVAVDASMTIANMQVAGGRKFDVGVDSKLTVDLDRLGAEIARFDVRVGEVAIAMSGSLSDLAGSPKFKDFTIRSTTLNPGLLLAYYPAARESLPKGLELEGAATLDVRASGDAARQSVRAALDLAGLRILMPASFVKPKGTALALRVDGDFTASDANLRKLQLQLDELDLAVAGTVHDFASPRLDLTLGAKPFSFDRLARLLPAVGEGLAKSQATASGQGTLAGHLKGTAANLDAAFDLGLLGVKLEVPGTRLDGDLRVKLEARGSPERDLEASFVLDADKAVIEIPDTLRKAATTPLRLDAAVRRSGDRIDVRRFDLHFAELQATATGGFDLARGTSDLQVRMQRLDLEKFARTVTALPADKVRGGFVDARIGVKGNPNQLETMELAIAPFEARFGRSDLRGEMRVVNPTHPDAVLKVTSKLLDVDELAPPEAEPPTTEAPATAPRVDDPSLKDYRFRGTFEVDRIVVRKNELRGFRGDVKLADGVLRLEDCTFSMFGGTVTAKGTEAEIWKGRMPFRANLVMKGVDMNQALTANTKYPDVLFGKADLGIELAGRGFETPELEENLLGKMSVAFKEGRFARASLTSAVVGDLSVLEKVPGLTLQPLKAENGFRDLAANFEVRDGRFNLTRPVELTVDGNRVVLSGAFGIAGKLFLQGDYYVPATMVETLTRGRCSAAEPLKIPVAIGGTVTAPDIRPDGKAVASELVERCLKQAAGKLVGDKAKQLLGAEVPTSKAEAEKRAREEAERIRQEAESKARAAADAAKAEAEARAQAEIAKAKAEAEQRARAEAERQRKAAEEAAKKKLREKAGGALKGFGL